MLHQIAAFLCCIAEFVRQAIPEFGTSVSVEISRMLAHARLTLKRQAARNARRKLNQSSSHGVGDALLAAWCA